MWLRNECYLKMFYMYVLLSELYNCKIVVVLLEVLVLISTTQ